MHLRDRARLLLGDFERRSSEPPSRSMQLFAVVVSIWFPVLLWDKRGAVVGLLGFAIYGAVFLTSAFRHRDTVAWSHRHPVLDALMVVPLTFLGLAAVTSLSLALCAVITAALAAAVVPLGIRRRRARTAAS